MSDEKSKKIEITEIIPSEIESSQAIDKEKTSEIDAASVEVQVVNSEEDSNNNEATDLKKVEETSEIENNIEKAAIVSEDIEKTSEVETKVDDNAIVSEEIENISKIETTDNSESAKGDESDDEESDEVNSSDDEVHEEEDVELKAQKDYHSLSPKELISELETLLKSRAIQGLKHDVDEITSEFNAQFQQDLEHKKEEFLADGGNIIDFHYTNSDKKAFNSLYFDYKEKRNEYYKSLKKDLQANFTRRNELIEELKGLLNAEENINTTYKHFKEIQENWRLAGAIPRDKYNILWNTYHHHVENFYDFLHLNREFRDLDFKHNLEQKIKLITRAEELAQETNINKAFRELQMLHKMWKEEIGPVAKQYRDEVWDKFSEATKVIHDKRMDSLKELEASFDKNYEQKIEIIAQINNEVALPKKSHKDWQNGMKSIQTLRDKYFEIGKVPRSKNKEIWNEFKDATRNFNHEKNGFYKNQKKEQFTNLEKKRALIKIAEDNKESDDFSAVTPLMKKIQSDWRTIGHVPRKDSDKVWKLFKDACNHYFDRIHAEKNEAIKEEMVHYDTKKEFLETFSAFTLSGDNKVDIANIKEKITEWKQIGRVPYNKKNIEQDFNKALDGAFAKLDLDKKEMELIKFENKLNTMVSQEDIQKLQNEQIYISKKIEESKNEIRQLENNLGFFKHVDKNNPMVMDVHTNIAKHKEQLEVWSAKMSKIRSARQG
jgi:hypothetical protein